MPEPKKRIWLTPKQKNEAALRYASGENAVQISKSFGVSFNNVINAVRSFGIDIRSASAAKIKYGIRHDAFDVLTSDAKYFCGFLFADGSVFEKKNASSVLTVALAERDRGQLEKLRAFLGSGRPLYNKTGTIRGKTHPAVQLTISSNDIAKALFSYGMKAKSLARVAPEVLTNSRDFWRGFVDGDGWIGVSASNNKKERLGACGGAVLLNQFLAFLMKHDIAHNTSIRPQKTIFRFDLSCSTAIDAMKLLYKNADTFLERKKNIVEALICGDKDMAILLRDPLFDVDAEIDFVLEKKLAQGLKSA